MVSVFYFTKMYVCVLHIVLWSRLLLKGNAYEEQFSSSQAFFQTNKVLSLVLDSANEFSSDILPSLGLNEGKIPANPVRFEPPYLDFKEHPIGEPHLEKVTLINSQEKKSLQLLSISATTPHFHCSFFRKKLLPAGQNTTFDVVFLARETGNVENTLFIKTSTGTYKYQLFGIGQPSPYRVRPFVGARIPINSSYSPYLHIYNPHPRPLQVTEMYSSGGHLRLELPGGVAGVGGRQLWEIPPYETRTVMRLRVIGDREANHSAYVMVKTNGTDSAKFGLVLPVEVEVSGRPGLFAANERLDFGSLTTLDNAKQLTLFVTNLRRQPIRITSVKLDRPNEAVELQFRPCRLLPGLRRQTPIATVTFTAYKAQLAKQSTGRLLVFADSESVPALTVPYLASVRHGALVYDANATEFFVGAGSVLIRRAVSLTNTFNSPVVIYNASLTGLEGLASLDCAACPVTMRPHRAESIIILSVSVSVGQLLNGRQAIGQLSIHSNASLFTMPVFLYTGALRLVPARPQLSQDELEFGGLAAGERRSLTFSLRNDNPVPVRVLSLKADDAAVQLLGVERVDDDDDDERRPTLRPFKSATYSLHLVASQRLGRHRGEIAIATNFMRQTLGFSYTVTDGSLTAMPDRLAMDGCFPGRLCCRWLTTQSGFAAAASLVGVRFWPADTRFLFVGASDREGAAAGGLPQRLKPYETATVGKICFDHRRLCGTECYAGFPVDAANDDNQDWLSSLSLSESASDIDQYYSNRLDSAWSGLSLSGELVANATVAMEVASGGRFLLHAQAHLTRPSLLPGWPTGGVGRLEMPVTQVGNESYSELTLENPSDSPVLIQLTPLSIYPNQQAALTILSSRLRPELGNRLWEADDNSGVVSLEGVGGIGDPTLEVGSVHRRQVELQFGAKVHPGTVASLIPGRRRAQFLIGFRPKFAEIESGAVILARNNLTGLEAVIVRGVAVEGKLTIEPTQLHFQLTEQSLRACGRSGLRRQLIVGNAGRLPFYVSGYKIGQAATAGHCSSGGFQLTSCDPFTLLPNQTRRLEVAYQPDFAEHRLTSWLTLLTSAGSATVPIRATLPGHLLAACAARLPRPDWERPMYTAVLALLVISALCSLISALFEADRIWALDVFIHCQQQQQRNGVFDLRRVGSADTPNNSSVGVDDSDSRAVGEGVDVDCSWQRWLRWPQLLAGSKRPTPDATTASTSSKSGVASAGAESSESLSTSAASASTAAACGREQTNANRRHQQQQQQDQSGHSKLTNQHHQQQQSVGKSANQQSASQTKRSRKQTARQQQLGSVTRKPDLSVMRTPQFEPIDFPDSRKGKSGKASAALSTSKKQRPEMDASQWDKLSKSSGSQTTGPRAASVTPDHEDSMSNASESSYEDKRSNAGSDSVVRAASGGQRSASTNATIERSTATPESTNATRQDEAARVKKMTTRVRSRNTATNTPSVSVQPLIQPGTGSHVLVKAAPLQQQQSAKQPKTSIVKPMTHQRPQKEEETEIIQWDLPVQLIKKEDLDEISHRTGAFHKAEQLDNSRQQAQQRQQRPLENFQHQQHQPSIHQQSYERINHQHQQQQQQHQQQLLLPFGPLCSDPLPSTAQPDLPSLLTPWTSAWENEIQQQQQQQQQQQLPVSGFSELHQVTLHKTQRMFDYEQLRRQQQQQQQFPTISSPSTVASPPSPPTPTPLASSAGAWYSPPSVEDSFGLNSSWRESTVSNRNLWGGCSEQEDPLASSSFAPVGSDTFLWQSETLPPVSSGWACFPEEQQQHQQHQHHQQQ